jgi:Fe-S-cluster containining protein
LERSQFFTHTALSQQTTRILEVEAFLYGLIDVLVEKGIALPESLKRAAKAVRDEMSAKEEIGLPVMGLRIDDEEPSPPREVNCAERMPICKAVCCTLDFALSQEEIESGRVKWDLGRPYFIRQDTDGHCCHNNRGTGGCGVYADRPLVCRQYTCEKDTRIWKDFDKMELNQEWIDRYLAQTRAPRLMQALMHRKTQLVDPSRRAPLERELPGPR